MVSAKTPVFSRTIRAFRDGISVPQQFQWVVWVPFTFARGKVIVDMGESDYRLALLRLHGPDHMPKLVAKFSRSRNDNKVLEKIKTKTIARTEKK